MCLISALAGCHSEEDGCTYECHEAISKCLVVSWFEVQLGQELVAGIVVNDNIVQGGRCCTSHLHTPGTNRGWEIWLSNSVASAASTAEKFATIAEHLVQLTLVGFN